MKKFKMKIWAGAVAMLFLASSCSDFLDINENPNAATEADVNLVLPQAITASASIASAYNNYGGHFGGYIANAGGFSGFGTLLSYNLTPADYNGLWTNTYQDPLNDFKYIIDKTEGDAANVYFNATAKIMSVFLYMKLVDTFGDVPYTDALRGSEGLVTPTYDDAATIYADLIATCDEAIAQIETAVTGVGGTRLTTASDPLFAEFAGDPVADHMEAWQKFANTLKLKMLVRISTPGNPAAGFATLDTGLGFISDDAIVDPGYELNRPNPAWATWGKTVAGALANSSRVPTTYSYTFFGGTTTFPTAKINDPYRGETIFVNFGGNNGSGAVTATPTNQLGNESGNPPIIAGQVTWAGTQTGFTGRGVLKGPAQGQPLMLAAEARFLEAEAKLHGYIAGGLGGATTTYYEGIKASFTYLYKDENEAIVLPPTLNAAKPVTIDSMVEVYTTTNAGNRLVEIEAASSVAQRVEAIITQKYIAMLMVTSDESYNEFRRTGFPTTVPGGPANLDIASNKSTITERFDRLPTRVMYPSSESAFNSANYRVVDYRSERIFWDPS